MSGEVQVSESEGVHRRLRLGSLKIDIATWVYGTVTLMSALVIYEGWTADIRFLGVVTVVIGPMIALAMAHLFAEVMEFQIEKSQRPSAAQWRHLIAHASQFLMVAIPPLVVLCVFALLPSQTVSSSIPSMIYLGVLSLGFWGWIGGRRSGYTGARLIPPTLAGLLIGLVVICFQLVLKPH